MLPLAPDPLLPVPNAGKTVTLVGLFTAVIVSLAGKPSLRMRTAPTSAEAKPPDVQVTVELVAPFQEHPLAATAVVIGGVMVKVWFESPKKMLPYGTVIWVLLFTAVIVWPGIRLPPLMVAPTSKAAVKYAPVQVIVVEEKNDPAQLHPLTDIGDVEIVSCAGEPAVLEAFCSHFNNTSVATPPWSCTKASWEPSKESVTEVLIVPPFVLYAQYPEGGVAVHPVYRLL
jgi:hypothetical protein